jgi:hypothetical protein
MSEEKKPADAGKAFADLAGKLVRVPKREVVRAEKRYERQKKKRKKS